MFKTHADQPLIIQAAAAGGAAPSPITLRIFTNTTDRDAIYGLRYRAYRHAELIGPAGAEEFSDSYDDLATTKTIGAFYNDACVGSLRLAFGRGGAKAATMPCQSIFGDVDILAASAAAQLVEFTRMVVDPAITNNSLRSTLYGSLVRGGMLVCRAGRADHAFIAVMPKMMRFYQFMCGFEFIAGPRPYPGVTEVTNLMGRNFRKLEARRSGRNIFFGISREEIDLVSTLFADEATSRAA